jgi:hypothetical protein
MTASSFQAKQGWCFVGSFAFKTKRVRVALSFIIDACVACARSMVLLSLIPSGFAWGGMLIPDAFSCPAGTRKILHDASGLDMGCYETVGSESDQELLLNSWLTRVKNVDTSGAQSTITSKVEYDLMVRNIFSEAIGKFSFDLRSRLPNVDDDAKSFVYTVKSDSSAPLGSLLISNIVLRTAVPDNLEFVPTEDESTTVLKTTTICRAENEFVHVEYPQGLVIEKFETGGLVLKDGTCKKSFLERPFLSSFSCEDRSSGVKLQFVFELPTDSALLGKAGKQVKDPVFLTFKVNGIVAFKKKISKDYDGKTSLYALAQTLRPVYLKKPLDRSLDAAFDCFDHLVWKSKGVSKEDADAHDRYDIKVIRDEVRWAVDVLSARQ